jgi:nucleotide-binding universal stress UspA family protein
MKTILFPTDFSKSAIHASHYAALLANIYDAKIILLNVDYIPMVPENHRSIEAQNAVITSMKKAHEDLKIFREQFIKDTNINPALVMEQVIYGFPADKIVQEAKYLKADMIVMGTKGASNFLDKWLGTNAEKVMKNADCPVWIIPLKAKIKQPKKIMYAADFKEDEILATQKVVQITEPLEAFCKVIHVHDIFEPIEQSQVKEQITTLNKEFEENDVFARNLNRSDIIEGLEVYIESFKPDVLALAVHDKTFLDRFFNESVTKHFVHVAQLPILTFRKS